MSKKQLVAWLLTSSQEGVSDGIAIAYTARQAKELLWEGSEWGRLFDIDMKLVSVERAEEYDSLVAEEGIGAMERGYADRRLIAQLRAQLAAAHRHIAEMEAKLALVDKYGESQYRRAAPGLYEPLDFETFALWLFGESEVQP